MNHDHTETVKPTWLKMLFLRMTGGYVVLCFLGVVFNAPSFPYGLACVGYPVLVLGWCVLWTIVQIDRWWREPRIVVHRSEPYYIQVPPAGPGEQKSVECLQKAHEKKLRKIDALPISEDERRDLKTKAEREFLRKAEELMQ